MKRLIYIFILVILFTSCNKSPITCDFSGQKVTKEIILDDFDKIVVNPGIRLQIIDTNFNKIVIVSDKDILENVACQIQGSELNLTNHTECTVANPDAEAHIKLYVKEITRIIANTDLDIQSGNIWRFNNLKIICENASIGNNNIADFDLQVAVNKLDIIANGSSTFKVTGTCNELFVGFYGVNPIFRGKYLHAEHIRVFQRSDADMHLYPVQSITGDLYGYGDIYLYHRPPVINITEHYSGHIYFVN